VFLFVNSVNPSGTNARSSF